MQPVVLAVLASIAANSEFIPSAEQRAQLQELLSDSLATDIATDERAACAPIEQFLAGYEFKVQAPEECPRTAELIQMENRRVHSRLIGCNRIEEELERLRNDPRRYEMEGEFASKAQMRFRETVEEARGTDDGNDSFNSLGPEKTAPACAYALGYNEQLHHRSSMMLGKVRKGLEAKGELLCENIPP